MAANISCTYVSLSRRIPQKTTRTKPLAGLNLRSLPLKLTSQPCQRRTKIDYRTAYSIPCKNSRRSLVMPFAGDYDPAGTSLTASELVRQFYTCINEKRLKELEELIAEDCCFEDCSYPDPIKGKEEVLLFYEQLTAGMGRNVKFSIEHVCEDDKFTAGVNWHIEWKKTQIPFTRGCSFYECSLEGNKLMIKKALVVIESPIKPGGIVLTLLKNVTAIFDDYPKAAEWFLQSFNFLQHVLSSVYTRYVAPILKPLLAGYIIMAIISQSQLSSLSRLDQVSNNDNASNGPRKGGRGGGLLKAAIRSFAVRFESRPPSVMYLFSCFLEVVTIPGLGEHKHEHEHEHDHKHKVVRN